MELKFEICLHPLDLHHMSLPETFRSVGFSPHIFASRSHIFNLSNRTTLQSVYFGIRDMLPTPSTSVNNFARIPILVGWLICVLKFPRMLPHVPPTIFCFCNNFNSLLLAVCSFSCYCLLTISSPKKEHFSQGLCKEIFSEVLHTSVVFLVEPFRLTKPCSFYFFPW